MRRRSLTGPVLLLLVGVVFLWHNLHPESPLFEQLSTYWPFLLIGWGFLRLIEVMLWRREGSFRGGLAWYEIVLIVLICIAGAGVWEARTHGFRITTSGLDILGPQYQYPITEQAPARGVIKIIVESPRGSINISGADADEVKVSGQKSVRGYSQTEADRANRDTPVEIIQQGDTLIVRTNEERASGTMRVSEELDILVPAAVSLEIRGGTGDFEITGISGNTEVRADRGDVTLTRLGGNARLEIVRSDAIRATGVKGDINLEGRGSDIDFSDISGQVVISGAYQGDVVFKNLAKPLQFDGAREMELRVASLPGNITMDLGDFSATDLVGPARLITRSRDIKIDRFSGSLEVDTDRGDIQLTPGTKPLPAIQAHSGSGQIDLALPPQAAFQLEATVEVGDAVNDFGPEITKEGTGRKATLRGGSGQGPSIRLTVDRGGISVRKQGILPGPPSAPARPPEPPQPSNPKGTEL